METHDLIQSLFMAFLIALFIKIFDGIFILFWNYFPQMIPFIFFIVLSIIFGIIGFYPNILNLKEKFWIDASKKSAKIFFILGIVSFFFVLVRYIFYLARTGGLN